MEQQIHINALYIANESSDVLNKEKILEKAHEAFKILRCTADDLNVMQIDANTFLLSCVAYNNRIRIGVSKETIGDPDCVYGTATYDVIEGDNFIDEHDIKKTFGQIFKDCDLDFDDTFIESENDVYDREEVTEYACY